MKFHKSYNVGINNPMYGKIPWDKGLTKDTDKRLDYERPTKFKKGHIPWCVGTKGLIISWNKGKHTGIKPWLGKKRPDLKNTNASKTMFKKGLVPWSKLHPEFMKGKKHWNWQNGLSFEPYGLEFNNELKEKIRKRDGYRCQECFRHQDELFKNTKAGLRRYKLFIHHIDYDKKNNNENNLISLCLPCHSQTSFSREDWTKYYQKRSP